MAKRMRRTSLVRKALSLGLVFLVGCATTYSNPRPGKLVRTETKTGKVLDSSLILASDLSASGTQRPPTVLRVSQCEQYQVQFRKEMRDEAKKTLVGPWRESPIGCLLGGAFTFGIATLVCTLNTKVRTKSEVKETGRIVEGEQERMAPVRCQQEPWAEKTLTLSVQDAGSSRLVWQWQGSTNRAGQLNIDQRDLATLLRVAGTIAGDGNNDGKILLKSEGLEGETLFGRADVLRLGGIDMDRSGKPRLTPFPKATVEIAREGRIPAGDLIPVTITVQNVGKDSLYQLKGRSRSSSALFDGLDFFFGFIPLGEKRTWTNGVRVPKSHPTEDIGVSIEFSELSGFVPEPLRLAIAVQGLPRPQFAFAYQVIDDGSGNSVGNGDGRLQKGEAADVLLTIKNTGRGPAEGVRASAAIPVLGGIVLNVAEDSVGDIPPDGAKTARFTVAVQRTAVAREIPLKIEIEEKGFSIRERFDITLPLDQRIPPQILAIRRIITVKRFAASLRGGSGPDTPEIGRVDQGDRLLAVGELGDWFQVQYGEGERAWIAKGDVITETGGAPTPSGTAPAVPKTTVVRVFQKPPPVIVVVSPAPNLVTDQEAVDFRGKVVDPGGDLQEVEVRVNDTILTPRKIMPGGRGAHGEKGVEVEMLERVPLRIGVNSIEIHARAKEDRQSRQVVSVTREPVRGALSAVVIGIDQYRTLQPLRYATADARAFYDYLVGEFGVPKDRVQLLLNEDATLTNLKTALGTWLPRISGPQDTVLIFYAGHGASEDDPSSPDGDALSKYLLPVDAQAGNLFATAWSMEEVRAVFARVRAKRLLFIADACYSGASGGRTIPRPTGSRDVEVSGKFLERLAQGEGRVILTASGPNELSREEPALGHGVFTYYLLRALRGAADADGDGYVTLPEVYQYVSREVAQATGQKQRPVLKGELAGEFILGRTKERK